MNTTEPSSKKPALGIEFFLTEFFVFISQLLVFFIVTYFISDMLSNEGKLTSFLSEKVNANTMSEFGLTLFAITFVMGILAIITRFIPVTLVEKIATEVLYELPRTFYLFGSSVAATTMCIGIYISNHPEASHKPVSGFFALSTFIAVAFFAYGCGIKALFSWRDASKTG